VVESPADVNSIAVDDKHSYWNASDFNTYRIPKTGGATESIAKATSNPILLNSTMLVRNSNPSIAMKKDGGPKITVLAALGRKHIDDNHMYWVEHNTENQCPPCTFGCKDPQISRVYRAPIQDSASPQLLATIPATATPWHSGILWDHVCFLIATGTCHGSADVSNLVRVSKYMANQTTYTLVAAGFYSPLGVQSNSDTVFVEAYKVSTGQRPVCRRRMRQFPLAIC